MLANRPHILRNLDYQLACRGHDEPKWLIGNRVLSELMYLLEKRDRKGGGFSGARLRTPQQILPFQQGWDTPSLDRSWDEILERFESRLDLRDDGEIRKLD
jgi:hypothetical protein